MDQNILITPYHSDIWFWVQSLGVKITVQGSDPSEQKIYFRGLIPNISPYGPKEWGLIP